MKQACPLFFVGLLTLALSMGGCGGNAPSAPADAEEPAETEALVEGDGSSVRGAGWQVLSGAEPMLSDDERDLFERCSQTLEERAFSPVAVLATQLVSGTNYAFLCEGEDASGWHVVVVYESLDGEAHVTSSQELKVDDLRVGTGAPMGALLGSWQVKDQTGTQLVPSDLKDAFDKVKDAYAEASLDPIAALASRENDGLDYLVLCEGEAREGDAPRSLFVVVVHMESGGAAQLQDVAQLEFLSCVSASA